MPNYDYSCTRCGTSREVQRPIADRDTPLTCEKCDEAMKRTVSAFGIGTGLTSTSDTEKPRGLSQPKVSATWRERSTAIRIEGGGGLIENCTFSGMDVGVSISEGTNISMKGNRFMNVPRHIEVTKRRRQTEKR